MIQGRPLGGGPQSRASSLSPAWMARSEEKALLRLVSQKLVQRGDGCWSHQCSGNCSVAFTQGGCPRSIEFLAKKSSPFSREVITAWGSSLSPAPDTHSFPDIWSPETSGVLCPSSPRGAVLKSVPLTPSYCCYSLHTVMAERAPAGLLK